MMSNAGDDAVDFGLPAAPPGTRWLVAADTSREAPGDLFAAGEEPTWEGQQIYHLRRDERAILLAR